MLQSQSTDKFTAPRGRERSYRHSEQKKTHKQNWTETETSGQPGDLQMFNPLPHRDAF